jgi:hypothetical protein
MTRGVMMGSINVTPSVINKELVELRELKELREVWEYGSEEEIQNRKSSLSSLFS